MMCKDYEKIVYVIKNEKIMLFSFILHSLR